MRAVSVTSPAFISHIIAVAKQVIMLSNIAPATVGDICSDVTTEGLTVHDARKQQKCEK